MVFKYIKIAIFLIAFAYRSEAISQNLVFSQVLTFDGIVSVQSPTLYYGGGYSEGPAYTVPAGKVWKVESFTFYRPLSYSGYVTLKLNSNILKCTGGGTFVPGVSLPFWLKSGDVLSAVYMAEDLSVGYGGNHPFAISIIEFTAP